VTVYSAFGLSVQSELPLPELDQDDGEPDVLIRLGHVDPKPPVHDRPGVQHHAEEGESVLTLDRVGTLRVLEGREIVVDPDPRCAESVVRALVVGPGLAALLVQRGFLVLHASAVEVDGVAVAFAGLPQAGKSTTAAALNAVGWPLVTDDILPADLAARPPRVLPGFARLKLWKATAEALGSSTEDWIPIYDGIDKAFRRAERMSAEPLPLERVYVLDEGDETGVEDILPGEAVVEILRHTWCATTLTALSPASHLGACAELTRRIPVRRLRRPRSLALVGEIAESVKRDLSETPALSQS
jgi:hypothetical protein